MKKILPIVATALVLAGGAFWYFFVRDLPAPEELSVTQARWRRVEQASQRPEGCEGDVAQLEAAAASMQLATSPEMEQLLDRLATSPEAYPAEALAPEALHALEAIARWAETGGGWWEPRWDGEQPMLQLVHITRLLAHVEPQRPDTDAILAHLVQQSVRCGMLLDAMMGTALLGVALDRSDRLRASRAPLRELALGPQDLAQSLAREMRLSHDWTMAELSASPDGLGDMSRRQARRERRVFSVWLSQLADEVVAATSFDALHSALDFEEASLPESELIQIATPMYSRYLERFETTLTRLADAPPQAAADAGATP